MSALGENAIGESMKLTGKDWELGHVVGCLENEDQGGRISIHGGRKRAATLGAYPIRDLVDDRQVGEAAPRTRKTNQSLDTSHGRITPLCDSLAHLPALPSLGRVLEFRQLPAQRGRERLPNPAHEEPSERGRLCCLARVRLG